MYSDLTRSHLALDHFIPAPNRQSQSKLRKSNSQSSSTLMWTSKNFPGLLISDVPMVSLWFPLVPFACTLQYRSDFFSSDVLWASYERAPCRDDHSRAGRRDNPRTWGETQGRNGKRGTPDADCGWAGRTGGLSIWNQWLRWGRGEG